MSGLALGPTVTRQLQRYAEVSLRAGVELCGILIGHQDAAEALVVGCAQLPNVAEDPTHAYQFDPDQQAQAWERVEGMGLEVLAIWHTHPSGPAFPSQTDVEYMQPWLLYAIMVPGEGLTVWRLRDKAYKEDSEFGAPAIGHSQYEKVPFRMVP